MLDTDYSTVGNETMFQRVLGYPVPKGVKVSKVTGHHGLGTGLVWMKLSGNDKSFDAWARKMNPLGKSFTYSIPNGFGVQKTFNKDALNADWPEVADLSHPEVYLFRNNGAERWTGDVVLSRSTHTGYVSGSLASDSAGTGGYGSGTAGTQPPPPPASASTGASGPGASPPSAPPADGGPPAGYAR